MAPCKFVTPTPPQLAKLIAMSPNGKFIAIAYVDSTVEVVDLSSQFRSRRINDSIFKVLSCEFDQWATYAKFNNNANNPQLHLHSVFAP